MNANGYYMKGRKSQKKRANIAWGSGKLLRVLNRTIATRRLQCEEGDQEGG